MNWSEEILIFIVAGLVTVAVSITGYGIPATGRFDWLLHHRRRYHRRHCCGQSPSGKSPMVFWVSILAIGVATPVSPFAGFISAYTNKVDFLAICTVVLSYAGLTIGKDLAMFKQMSWRIIVVALAIYTERLSSRP